MSRHRHCPECGCVLSQPRSAKEHRFFFAIIAAAFDNWPEGHEFQPRNAEQLRGWLMLEVGEHERLGNGYHPSRPSLTQLQDFVMQAIHQVRLSHYGRLAVDDEGAIELHYPRSVALMHQKEFHPVVEKILLEIQAHTGLTPRDLRRAAAAATAPANRARRQRTSDSRPRGSPGATQREG